MLIAFRGDHKHVVYRVDKCKQEGAFLYLYSKGVYVGYLSDLTSYRLV